VDGAALNVETVLVTTVPEDDEDAAAEAVLVVTDVVSVDAVAVVVEPVDTVPVPVVVVVTDGVTVLTKVENPLVNVSSTGAFVGD